MLRQLSLSIALVCAAQFAHAAEAGKVIFVAGSASVADKPVAEGAPVQEGDLLSTGPTGFMYVKTIDKGLFILRPNTKARIAAYHVDASNPANTRIKLELISGVARSRSGEAVKLARQNFRFNTPVAAIGVRGTDFTVFTDQDTSRVAVISGGVVVSGFGGACRPDGSGPCEGVSSRELSASQRGVLLQIQRGQSAPQLMQGGATAPDQVAPPRVDEPIGKNGGVNGTAPVVAPDTLVEAKKNVGIVQVNKPAPAPTPPPPAPVVVLPPTSGVVTPEQKEMVIYWGRWQPLLNQPVKIHLEQAKNVADVVAIEGNFALLRSAGEVYKPYVTPNEGAVGFQMKGGEAYVYTDNEKGQLITPATLSNGSLNLDFGARTFTTKIDLDSQVDSLTLSASGTLSSSGLMFGDQSFGQRGVMDVKGVLSDENGGSAAYVFRSRLDPQRTVDGVTHWVK